MSAESKGENSGVLTTNATPALPDPLVIGTTLLDRFTIIEILPGDPAANVYRVAEIRACPHCGVENEGNLDHCGFCGTELPAPRTLVLMERSTPANGQVVPTAFEQHGMTYAFGTDTKQTPDEPPAMPAWSYGFKSDPGIARSLRGDINEDSVLALRYSSLHANTAQDMGIMVLADGVGGAAAGEIASELAVRTIAQGLADALLTSTRGAPLSDDEVLDILRGAISEANQQIIEYGHSHSISLGTTVVLALLNRGRLYLANVGDSRAYLFRREELTQITRDHSYVAELRAKGELTADEARRHPQRNLILKSLGDPTGFQMDLFSPSRHGLELRSGDKLLLCSDGLWEMVQDDAIARVLAQPLEPAETCAQLVQFANAAGGGDNISVLIVQMADQ